MNKQEIIAAWKDLARNKTNTCDQYILCSILRSIVCEQSPQDTLTYLKAAFSPIVRSSKLSNGRYPYDTLLNRLWHFQFNSTSVRMSAAGIFKTKQEVIDQEKDIQAYAKQIYDILLAENHYRQNLENQKALRHV